MAAIQGMGFLGGGKKDAWTGNFSPISDRATGYANQTIKGMQFITPKAFTFQ